MRYLLSQQLVSAGEDVPDVPATLASRIRVLGTGRSNKNDPNDALSVAIAALRSPGLRPVRVADHGELLRLLAKRNHEIGRLRNITVSRLHAALLNLSPGGIAKELNASDAVALLGAYSSSTPPSKGPGGQAGTTRGLRGRLCTLVAGSSAKSLPDPTKP
jgi:hypothetical protein